MKITRSIKAEGEFTAAEIREILLERLCQEDVDCHANFEVFVEIPSGGDYSGTTLSLDDVRVVWSATWTETEDA